MNFIRDHVPSATMPFKIYRSSAGSGKTFTLVKEYLRISLATERSDAYRHILAITFTNKAAEEMKARVLEVLSELSNPSANEHAMAQILRDELAIADETLKLRAHNTLRHMLHHYSDISISTIDHFTHKLIRSFAQDLDLSVNFEVELDSDRIINEIVKELLSRVGSDKVLTDALLNVVESQTENEKGWSVNRILNDFSKALFEEESRFHLEKLKNIGLNEFNQLRSMLKKKISAYEKQMSEAAKQAYSSLKQAGISEEKMYYGAKGVHAFISRTARNEFGAPNSYVKKSVAEDKWTSGKADVSDKSAIEDIKNELILAVETVESLLPETNCFKIIFENLYGVALLDEMLRIQKQIQEDEEILHIGEFNHLVSNVVMTETAPFIYERIGYRYNHFLVDEFQDTSVLQWFNLLPLVDESLAHDNLCLIVGDAKQSIYRWRGGDVQQFVELPAAYRTAYLDERLSENPEMVRLMNEREQSMKAHEITENLDSNYRSFSNVVDFNNQLFEKLPDAMSEKLATMYDGASQKITKSDSGMVKLRFFQPEESSNRSWPEYVPLTLEQIEEWVNEALADRFAAGDIAIILRRNSDAVAVAQYLVERKFKVVSNESLLINSSPKVRLLVNMATWLADDQDTVNIVEMVQHFGLVRNEEDQTPERLMRIGRKPETRIKALIDELYPNVNWKAIKQESLFGQFELLKHHFLGNGTDAYVNFFFDEILKYSKSNSDGLLGFLEHWKEKRDKLSIALPEKDDAIRIMTIHKSKGLEFPVVIHPFVDYPTNNRGNEVWAYLEDEGLKPLDRIRITTGSKLEGTPFQEENEQENQLRKMDMFNELYVAFTRAKARLYACGKVGSKTTSTAIQYVFDELKKADATLTEELRYQLGERTEYTRKNSEQQHFKLHNCGDPNWKSRISISRPSKDKWKTADESDARNLGILIHEALAHVKTDVDIPNAVNILIEDGRISVQESEELQQHMQNLIARSELKPLYTQGNTIRNEVDIQLSDGKWVRPDRVVYQNDSAWVLDYKTGKETGKHKKQMEAYKQAMIELGFKQVRGMLVYLNEEKVVTV